jgi:hypothetical protein
LPPLGRVEHFPKRALYSRPAEIPVARAKPDLAPLRPQWFDRRRITKLPNAHGSPLPDDPGVVLQGIQQKREQAGIAVLPESADALAAYLSADIEVEKL